MPGFLTKEEWVAVSGVQDLQIRSLLDNQQFDDPQGLAEAWGISSAQWPLFGLIWPSAHYLAARMALRLVNPAERILELGCGLGLASLVAHRRGADITASDCHPNAQAFLDANADLNGLGKIKFWQARWGRIARAAAVDQMRENQSPTPTNGRSSGRFDLIIASDVLYERDPQGALASFISLHAKVACEVWIVDPDRGNRASFSRHMRELGFDVKVQKLVHAESVSDLAYRGHMLSYSRHGV